MTYKTNDVIYWSVAQFDGTVIKTNFTANITTSDIAIGYGLSLSFGGTSGHKLNDRWKFVGIRTNHTQLVGSKVDISEKLDTSDEVNQITLAQGFKGQGYTAMWAYKMAPIYAIADQTVEIFELRTRNPNPANNVRFAFNISGKTSQCQAWDAADKDVEKSLVDILDFCPQPYDDNNLCVSVSKSKDKMDSSINVYRFY
jgi:hypothetical protein